MASRDCRRAFKNSSHLDSSIPYIVSETQVSARLADQIAVVKRIQQIAHLLENAFDQVVIDSVLLGLRPQRTPIAAQCVVAERPDVDRRFAADFTNS